MEMSGVAQKKGTLTPFTDPGARLGWHVTQVITTLHMMCLENIFLSQTRTLDEDYKSFF